MNLGNYVILSNGKTVMCPDRTLDPAELKPGYTFYACNGIRYSLCVLDCNEQPVGWVELRYKR